MPSQKTTIAFDLPHDAAALLIERGRSFPGLTKHQVARKLLTDTLAGDQLSDVRDSIDGLLGQVKRAVAEIPAEAQKASEAALDRLAGAQAEMQAKALREIRLDVANLQAKVEGLAAGQVEVVRLLSQLLPKL